MSRPYWRGDVTGFTGSEMQVRDEAPMVRKRRMNRREQSAGTMGYDGCRLFRGSMSRREERALLV